VSAVGDARKRLEENAAYHGGVVYGLRHPGPSQMGCAFCIDTLRQGVAYPALADGIEVSVDGGRQDVTVQPPAATADGAGVEL